MGVGVVGGGGGSEAKEEKTHKLSKFFDTVQEELHGHQSLFNTEGSLARVTRSDFKHTETCWPGIVFPTL